MSTKVHNKQQLVLTGMEQAQCACGCGEHFFRATSGRKREYINATHKKRAARARAAQGRTEGTVHLTPKGWVYFLTDDNASLQEQWEALTDVEQRVVKAICDAGISPREFLEGVELLFRIPLSHK